MTNKKLKWVLQFAKVWYIIIGKVMGGVLPLLGKKPQNFTIVL